MDDIKAENSISEAETKEIPVGHPTDKPYGFFNTGVSLSYEELMKIAIPKKETDPVKLAVAFVSLGKNDDKIGVQFAINGTRGAMIEFPKEWVAHHMRILEKEEFTAETREWEAQATKEIMGEKKSPIIRV